MLFTATQPITPELVVAIEDAVRAQDAFAQVRVDAGRGLIRIDGRLDPQAALQSLALAGCHVQDGMRRAHGANECCGGCS